MGKKIGIDLGTTNTVAAIMDGPRPRVLDNKENKSQTRSVVGLKKARSRKGEADGGKGEILVGEVAVANWSRAPKDTIISVKRLMGRGMKDEEVQLVKQWSQYDVRQPSNGTADSVSVILGGEEYAPEDISALILKKAKEDAEFKLGDEVTYAVITVPAYFTQIQRSATHRAGLKAGLEHIKLLDEPTAAAIAFGTETQDENPRTLLVYDLGGGTFDVSLLMVAGSVFAPLNLEGDMWLGGDNLDQVIVDRALEWVEAEYEVDGRKSDTFMAELRKSAQAVKEQLSSAGSADLIVVGRLQDEDGNLLDVDMEISGDEFVRDILPLVGRYRECSCGVANLQTASICAVCGAPVGDQPVKDGRAVQIVKRAMANGNQTPEQIDHVIMAGNSSAVPLVQESMEELFGAEKVLRNIHPKLSVAMGAAIVAAWGAGGTECQAPDPANPAKVCGKDNEPGATNCEKCGAPLGLADDAPEAEGEGAGPRGTVGGIAPVNYGTQTADDTFNVFVHKSDPFPTEDPVTRTFFTVVPGQRMVSIPVYGGDNLEKASANDLEGQAFALLPPDLPAKTQVRIRLWLNNRGVFALSAHLGDGTKLDPWVLEGGVDAAVIEQLEAVEALMAKHADAFSPQALGGMEGAREEVFEQMNAKDFEGAAEKLKALEAKVQRAVPEDEETPLAQQAAGLMGFAEMVLTEFKWAFTDPAAVYRITRAVEETREALDAGNETALQTAVGNLDKVTDDLPGMVRVILSFRGAIHSRIHPVLPGRAAELMAEVENLEGSFQNLDVTVGANIPAMIETLGQKITKAIEEADEARGLVPCMGCGQPLSKGQRICECGRDSWIMLGSGM